MDLKVAALTDTGRARANNEDSLLADPPLVAVADGMGGHEGGEVASNLAVEVLKGWKDKLEGSAGKDAADRLTEAFQEANRTIFERGKNEEALRGMGTTLTAAWVEEDRVALAHVGDSRAYLLRGGNLQQLTEDQNVAQEWVRRGRLTAEEAASSPHRHIVLQAIGPDPDGIEVATVVAELRPGDKLVLASDGLFGMVQSKDALRDILLAHPDNDDACRALIDAANAAGGADNISVVILELGGDPAVAAADDDEVKIERGDALKIAAPKPPRRNVRIPRLGMVISGAVLLVGLMLFLLFRPSEPNYVVSTRDGVIVVLDGKVGTTQDPMAKGDVVRRYPDRELEEFSPYVQRQFRIGFDVDSLADAERLIDRQIRQLGPKDTPTPKPKPTGSATPDPSPTEEP
jgi:PPM family protein phosphatase